MGQPAKKQDIEEQLLGVDDTVEEIKRISTQEIDAILAAETEDEAVLFFNEDGSMSRHSQPSRKLEGAEAMKFLNLPTRKFNIMQKNDLARIRWKFKDLFEKWGKENKPGRNENTLFWDKIRVRVINKKYAGQPTRGCPSAGIEPGKYQGDIMLGEAIKCFLPETRFSNAGDDFYVLLLSITVTEELENV